MDLGTQEAILRFVNQYGPEKILVLLGAPDGESAEIAAETVILGDPTYAGPLTETQLGLDTYHILEDEVRSWVPEAVYEEQIGVMADVLDAGEIATAVRGMRERRGAA